MKLTKANIKAIEDLGWSVEKTDFGYCLENYSPAGEELVIEVEDKESIISYCDNYDCDEHFELWYGANRGEPSSPRALMDDCDAIGEMLEQLGEVLKQ